MSSKLIVPDVAMELKGKETLMIIPGGISQKSDAIIDYLNGPSQNTPANTVVTELGGPVTDMYEQTKDVHWQTNFYGYGTEQNLQGSPVPYYNMNTRKLLYVYGVDDNGNPKPIDSDNGFRIFLMFDFIFWAEDPTNKLSCLAPASSAAKVDPNVRVPFWKTPMQILHNWPKRWQFILYSVLVAFVMAVLCALLSRSWGKTAVIFVISLFVAGLVSLGAMALTNAMFNKIQYCAFFDKPSCWTGLPDMAYENADDKNIYKWKSDAIRTFGGLPEIGASWGYQYRTRLLQYLVANGFCVVMPGFSNVKLETLADAKALGALVPFKFDCQDWYWAPAYVNNADPKLNYASQNNGCAGGWPGPDAAMLSALISEMQNGALFGLGPMGGTMPFLNLNRLTLGGYSAGAQMVSRCINEFPVMSYIDKVSGVKTAFPAVRAGFMLSGGVYHCYTGLHGWDNGDNPDCGKAPTGCPIDPTADPTPPSSMYAKLIGCCPENVIEARYSKGGSLSVLTHPPMILAQTENDSDADCSAHKVYSDALINALKNDPNLDVSKISTGVKTVSTCWTSDKCNGRPIAPPRQAIITLDDCSAHTWFPELIVPVAQFLKDMTENPVAPEKGYFSK